MRSFSSRLATGLLALAAVFTLSSAQAQTAKAVASSARVTIPVDPAQTSHLSGHLPFWATADNEFGPVDPGLKIDTAMLVLNRAPEVQAAFDQLLLDQQDPASPRYHQWITPEQAGKLYGVAQHDVDAVTAWLTSQGLRVESVGPDNIFITFSGPASAIARALSTEFRSYNRVGTPRYSINSEPSVPAALAPVVKGFMGLSEMYFHTTHNTSELHQLPKSNGLTPMVTSTSGNHYLAPADFNLIFNIKPAVSGVNGTGVRVAYVAGARVGATDIANYQSTTGLAAYTPTYIVVPGGADPGAASNTYSASNVDNGNQDESTLDFNRINGTAPGAGIDVLLDSGFLSYTHLISMINYNTNTLKDPILSLSVGGCESGNSLVNSIDSAFTLAAAGGTTSFVSSGDSAAAGCEGAFAAPTHVTQTLSPNVLCSSAAVTCVGGTEFADTASPSTYWGTSNGTGLLSAISYIPEGGWNEPLNSAGKYVVVGSGGGVSSVITKPTFQAGVGVPADGFRDTPDVSFPAAAHDGYYACLTYLGGDCVTTGFFDFSGTSAAAPSMAGVMALVVQKLGSAQGNFNPRLYTLAATPSNGVFHDVTVATSAVSGCVITTPSMCNNSTVGIASVGATATLTGGLQGYLVTNGYDQVTGLGSIDVGKLITAVSLTPTTTTVQPNTGTVTYPVQFTSFVSASSGHATGTVQLQSNGVNLGSPVALVTSSTPGLATASTAQTFNTAGTYAITAIYSGDATYAASTSAVDNLVISKVNNSVTLTAAPTSISTSQTTTLTATIAQSFAVIAPGPHPQALSPTGTVQFFAGANAVGSPVAVSGGQAVLVTPTFATGSYSMTAVYSGDSTFAAGTSNAVTLTVNNGLPTTTTLSASATNFTAQQTAVFTATVGATGTPTGTVQFLVDGVAKGAPVALVAKVAVSPALSFTSGSHVVTATYSGDATFAGSTTSTGTSVTVTAVTSGIGLVAASSSVTTQQSDLLTATVTGTGSPSPTGTVQFLLDGVNTGTPVTISAGGVATYTLAAGQTAGSHNLTATYSGDTVFSTSTSTAVPLTVSKVATTSTVIAASAAISTLQSDLLTATVAGTGATGTVTFKDGATTLGSPVTLTAGTATYTAAAGSLSVGVHNITAVYSGDAVFAASTTATAAVVTVSLAPTTTTLVVGSANITNLQSDLFTATVSNTAVTGTVTFRDGTTVLGSPVTPVAGVATYTAAAGSLAVGAHSITATYSGDAVYATSASAASSVTVIAAPVFTLGVNPSALTITAGAASANSVTLTATAVSGTPAPITLTCAIVYNNGTAVVSPSCPALASVSPTVGNPATITVTIGTVAPHGISGSMQAHLRGIGTTALCALFLFALPLARRRNWRSLVAVVILAAGFAGITGCSSGNALTGGTTTGNYTVTITGTSTGAATQTTTFTLTVN